MPTDPAPPTPSSARDLSGETRTEWRNVYHNGEREVVSPLVLHPTRETADEWAKEARIPRIAVERIETTITRIPLASAPARGNDGE